MKTMYVHIFIFFNLLNASFQEACPKRSDVITLKDVQDAAYASKEIYDDNLHEGDKIPNTQFTVTKCYHKELTKGGEGIRVMVADNGNTRMIVYRGTDGIEQLLAQGKSAVFKKEEIWNIGKGRMEILTFFFKAYELASYDLRPYIRFSSKKYILTGHSLGGALASILALDATRLFKGSVWKNPKSCLITFGQPRVGGNNFAKIHDKLISTYRKLRFIYESDFVPKIPFEFMGWKHFSRAVYMGTERYNWFGKRSVMDETHDPRNVVTNRAHLNNHMFVKTPAIRNASFVRYPRLLNGTLGAGNATKRFWWTKTRKYWQICKIEDEADCVPTFAWPSVNDHKMTNYINSLKNPPSHVYGTDGRNKESLEEALFRSCST